MHSGRINQFLREVVTYNVLTLEEVIYILTKVKIDKGKKCWFYREDWSVYVVYKKKPLHRLIFETFKGKIDSGKFICHRCDRPGCINPNHLFQGTASDNYRDALNKNRVTRFRPNNKISTFELDQLRKQDREKKIQLPRDYEDAHWNRNRR